VIQVDLHVLLDGLVVLADGLSGVGLGGSTAPGTHLPSSISIVYDRRGSPLVISATEADGVEIQFRVRTLIGHPISDFAFLSTSILSSVIVRSDALRDAVQELEWIGSPLAELRLGPNRPRFRLECDDKNSGAYVSVELPDPDDVGTNVFTEFKSQRVQVSCYRLSQLKRCTRAFSMSETTKLRMNSEGMLDIAIKMKSAVGTYFVEFIIVAEEIDAEGGENSEEHSQRGPL